MRTYAVVDRGEFSKARCGGEFSQTSEHLQRLSNPKMKRLTLRYPEKEKVVEHKVLSDDVHICHQTYRTFQRFQLVLKVFSVNETRLDHACGLAPCSGGSSRSMAWIRMGSLGWVSGEKRATTCPRRLTRNFSKFQVSSGTSSTVRP